MTNFTTTGNYLHSKLQNATAISDTSITLQSGNGFPAGSATNPIIAVIWSDDWYDPSLDDTREIVKIYRDSGDTYVLQAVGQENTTHRAWDAGSNIAVTITAGKTKEWEDAIHAVEEKSLYLGAYTNETALRTAHPTGSFGEYAIVGSTDTTWVWDVEGADWVDSGMKGAVTSVNGRTGVVVATAGDYDANQIDYDNTNGVFTANDTNVQDAIESLDNATPKAYTDTFPANETTYTINVSGLTANDLVKITPQGAKVGTWSVISTNGSFTITSDTTETSAVLFAYEITKGA